MKKLGIVLITTGVFASLANGFVEITKSDKSIKGQYVVLFKEGKEKKEINQHMIEISELMVIDDAQNSELLHEYSIGDSFNGYALRCSSNVIKKIQNSNIVKGIYEDGIAGINAQQTNPPSWGLDRISQRTLPLDLTYKYPDASGEGVNVYSLDTGVYLEHSDFGGRAVWGVNLSPGCEDNDLNGHGTHVAGTIAGTSYGVAKKANIVAVKVLGDTGNGAWSEVIAGVHWVAYQHNASSSKKSVANMSLGGPAYLPIDEAVNAASQTGVHISASSGNENSDACNYSPARASGVVCTGSTNVNDGKSGFSNYGKCVSIHAPGESIVSAFIGNRYAASSLSGTSMATPHVSGVMALYLSTNRVPSIENLQALSTKNVITGLPAGTQNYLLFSDANF